MMVSLLVLSIVVTVEALAFGGDIHPQATLATYRARALDLDADNIAGICGGRQEDVLSLDVRSARVGQWQQVHRLRLRGCGHDGVGN